MQVRVKEVDEVEEVKEAKAKRISVASASLGSCKLMRRRAIPTTAVKSRAYCFLYFLYLPYFLYFL